MKIMIYEPVCTGHRLQYVRVLIESLSGLVDEVILITSAHTLKSQEYKTHLRELEDRFTLDASMSMSSQGFYRQAFDSVLCFAKKIKQHNPGRVYVPYADGFAQVLGIARFMRLIKINTDIDLEILLMRLEYDAYINNWKRRIKNWLWITSVDLSGAKVVHLLNPITYENIKSHNVLKNVEVSLMPEAVEPISIIDINLARDNLNIPRDGRYISCLGVLDKRKGVDLLVKAFSEAKINNNDRLLLMGVMSSDIKDLIESEYASLMYNGRLIMVDRYVSQSELINGLCASDVICTPYPDHLGSSGIIVRASAINKPVLAANIGWMNYIVTKFKLGQTCNVKDASQFASAIEKSLLDSNSYFPSTESKRFNKFNTVSNFSKHWSRLLNTVKNPLEDKNIISWNWVLGTEY